MRIIAMRTLRDFWSTHADAQAPLRTWVGVVRRATWSSMAELKLTFSSASVIDRETVVFNIHGNNYRLVARVFFPAKHVYVKFIGTHEEYDALDLR